MKITKISLLFLALSLSALSGIAQTVRHLGDGNNIVTVDGKEPLLMLPIQEDAPEARVIIVKDFNPVQTLYVRLAQSRTDYMMPLDLYKAYGIKNQREAKTQNYSIKILGVQTDAICWKNLHTASTYDNKNREKYRPEYHFTPAYGWMNDPNGMFYKDGTWHLFYQYNPYGSMWGNMHWGHASSTDLIHWNQHSIAVEPDAWGAAFSGSCAIDHDNTAGFGKDAVIGFYTSAGERQTQSLIYSTDGGENFHKYEGNPVITSDQPDFRDPNFFWHEPTQRWIMLLAVGQELQFFSSKDLKDWKKESSFGHINEFDAPTLAAGYGNHSGVWECPDMFELKFKNEKTKKEESKWVLICNINPGGPNGGSATQYFIGQFDGHKFICEDEPEETKWMDYGKDHYATVSFSGAPNDRHSVIAWMSNWQYANNVPTMQYRSGNSIVRDPFLYQANGETYLGSRPATEYDEKGLDQVVKIKGSSTITLSNDEGEEFVIIYDQKEMTLTIDRSKSGETAFSPDFAVPIVAPVHKKLTSLRFFIDRCSVELFGNNGEVVMTNLAFPKSTFNKIEVSKN